MSRLRSTALPALVFGVSVGLLGVGSPAMASTATAPAARPVSSAAVTQAVQLAAKPRPRVAPPKKIVFHEFEQGKVTISWSHVRGIVRYRVHAYKIDPKWKGSPYPFNAVPDSIYWATTKRQAYTFVDNFTPRSEKERQRLLALPWTITVSAISPNKAHRDSSPKAPTFSVKDKIIYKTVVIKKKPSAKEVRGYKSVIKKCVAIGAGAAVTTAVTTGGAAVLATWVPGLNAVSWGAVATLTVLAGTAGTLGCFVTEKINPDSLHHLRVVSA